MYTKSRPVTCERMAAADAVRLMRSLSLSTNTITGRDSNEVDDGRGLRAEMAGGDLLMLLILLLDDDDVSGVVVVVFVAVISSFSHEATSDGNTCTSFCDNSTRAPLSRIIYAIRSSG